MTTGLLRIPAALNWYYNALRLAEDIGRSGVTVLDGPSIVDMSSEGLAVGASLEEAAGEFTMRDSDVTGRSRQGFNLTCLAWAYSGDPDYQKVRPRCAELVRLAEEVLGTDPTMGGNVSNSSFGGGAFNQQMDPEIGVKVTIEFRIEAVLF